MKRMQPAPRAKAAHLTEDDVVGTHHQEVAFELPGNLLLHPVAHVQRVLRVQLVHEDLFRQLDC